MHHPLSHSNACKRSKRTYVDQRFFFSKKPAKATRPHRLRHILRHLDKTAFTDTKSQFSRELLVADSFLECLRHGTIGFCELGLC